MNCTPSSDAGSRQANPSATKSSGSNLALPQLLDHALLKTVGAPLSGSGTLFWTNHLLRCLTVSLVSPEWRREADSLLHLLNGCGIKHGASSKLDDKCDPVWATAITCMAARENARQDTQAIDALLATAVIHMAARSFLATASFFSGLTQLYKAARHRQNQKSQREWCELIETLNKSGSELPNFILQCRSATCRQFAMQADRILQSPLAPVETTNSLQTLLRQASQESTSGEAVDQQHKPIDADGERTSEIPAGTEEDEKLAGNLQADNEQDTGFQHGDSVNQYLRRQAPFTAHRSRLGLPRKSSTLPEQLPAMVAYITTCLLKTEDPLVSGASLLALMQICFPVPAHVLLGTRCQSGDDLYFDLAMGGLRIDVGHIRPTIGAHKQRQEDTGWLTPLPLAAARALKDLQVAEPQARRVADLLCQGKVTQLDLVRTHHDLLRKSSDINNQIWPGQWLAGLRSAAIHAMGSELLAAFVLAIPGLSAPGALYYYAPTQQSINRAAKKWHVSLGLEPVGSSPSDSSPAESVSPSDSLLRTGFDALIHELCQLRSRITRHRGQAEELLPDFNELAALTAGLVVFGTASRGTKIEAMRNGSLYCHPALMHVNDKEVEDERGSRLLPKTQAVIWALNLYGAMQRLVATRLLDGGRREDLITELSKGWVRFEAPCFQQIEIKNARLIRLPIAAADVARVARRYFNRQRNFMRHEVVTGWTNTGQDPMLLRALTGHAWDGAEVPSACSTYAPYSAILAIREPLEQLLTQWVNLPDNLPEDKPPQLMAIPLRGIYKARSLHKLNQKGTQGPIYERWHLAADTFCRQVRQVLLSGPRDLGGLGQLWLSLAIFDGIFEAVDLDAIFETSAPFTRGRRGWKISWRRPGDRSARVVPVQVPTALLLERVAFPPADLTHDDIKLEVRKWLEKRFPQIKKREDTRKIDSTSVCLSAVGLWFDLVLPSGLQAAYEPTNHAPVISRRSAENAIDQTDFTAPPLGICPRHPSSGTSQSKQLADLIRIVHRAGNSQEQLGEQKARANFYRARVAALGDLPEGSWAKALNQVVHCNIRFIEGGRREAIKFSSLSTYLSHWMPAFDAMLDLNLEDLDEMETFQLAKALFEKPGSKGLTRQDKEAADVDRQAAAIWLIKRLREVGYRMPTEKDLERMRSAVRAARSQSTPLIDHKSFGEAEAILTDRHGNDSLRMEQVQAGMQLLKTQPLRWMELATLNSSHLSACHPHIRLEASGFGHIKSSSSLRTLNLEDGLHQRLTHLAFRLQALHPSASSPLLFASTETSDPSADLPVWLHQEITWVMRHALGDDFRLHHFRANAINEAAYPGWQQLLKRWINAKATAADLFQFFEYTRSGAWRSEEVAIAAGHSRPSVAAFFYIFSWPLVRAMALASLVSDVTPSLNHLKQVGITGAALAKASQRNSEISSHPWNLLASKLWSDVGKAPSEPALKNQETLRPLADGSSATNSRPEADVTMESIRYLCLLSCAVESTEAADACRLTSQQEIRFHRIFAGIDSRSITALRRREGTQEGGRSLRAEAGLVRSNLFVALYKLAAPLNPEIRQTLLEILRPPKDKSSVDEALIRTVAQAFDGSEFVLEIVFGMRHVDPAMNARLFSLPSLLIGSPARDVSRNPRAFVVYREGPMSLVVKARIRSVMSLLCFFLNSNEQNQKNPLP